MEEIYASLSQTGNTLDDAARNNGGLRRHRQSSAELGSQEYLDGLRRSQEAIAQTSFRRPRNADNENKNGSRSGAKFEHLGETSYRFGEPSTVQNQSGVSASRGLDVSGKLGNAIDRTKSLKLPAKPGDIQRGRITQEKFKPTIHTNHNRNVDFSSNSGDSSDELNLTSSSQPIRSPKKGYTFSDAGTGPPGSDSDGQDTRHDLPSLVASRSKVPSSLRKPKSRSSKPRARHDENSFSDETPEKKKLKIRPLVEYARNSSSLRDSDFSSPPRMSKGGKSRLGKSQTTNFCEPKFEGGDEEETPRLKRISSKKPAPFPMAGSAIGNGDSPVTRGKQKRRPAPFPMSMETADDCATNDCDKNRQDSGSDEEDPLLMNRNDEIINRGGLAPFPMSLDDRPFPSDSEFPKGPALSADESDYHAPERVQRDLNEIPDVSDVIERSFTQASRQPDPKALCPYCDMPFPPNPTPLLLAMLKRIPRYPDPRPTNPLGLKAPLLSYVSMCQRHEFEMQLLPKARAAGWPTNIDFAALPERICALRQGMAMVLRDKETSVFWRELKKQIDKQGARKTMGITNQFDSFERSQPGYYGEQGAVIITQALSNLFPLDSMDPSRVAPLTPMEFIRCILVPECAVALIQEDLGSGTSKEHAIRTLRKSSKYGTAMFPDLDNRDAMSVGKDTGTAQQVGEAIVKERVRARRVEISEEEREAEDTGTSLAGNLGRKSRTYKQQNKGKAVARPAKSNEIGCTIELSDSSSAQTNTSTHRRKLHDVKRSERTNAAVPMESSRKSTKRVGEKTGRNKVRARPKVVNYSAPDPMHSSAESIKGDMHETTPKPRTRTCEPYDSDSGIVLPEEDNRYEKAGQRSSKSPKTSKINGSFLPLQAAKARKTQREAVFERTMWEDDDESDDDDTSGTSINTSEIESSHTRRPTTLGRTETHSWLLSDASTPRSTPQR